jgi:hypothetical protein
MTDRLLGEGEEGRVYRRGAEVVKFFHNGVISEDVGKELAAIVGSFGDPFPAGVRICKEAEAWVVRYPWFDSEPVYDFTKEEAMDYLIKAGKLGVIADNFKPSNLRRRAGHLVYVDIGRHIRAFNRSTFRDVCAKAFALLHGWSEEQLVNEFEGFRASGAIARMTGFAEFYADVVERIAKSFWATVPCPITATVDRDVTLLIKCCAMDSAYLERQVGHIVHRLSCPRKFKEVVLSIDSRLGAFLRQHSTGDIGALRSSAQRLLAQGVVDRIIEAPGGTEDVVAANLRWFGLPSSETHTASGIPVYPQVWAFEQIETKYVLQADCDVLICRQDFAHDYLSEMLVAHASDGVMGVGFNIPQSAPAIARPYEAPLGEFKPEVRLGLFDLMRLRASLPLPNRLSGAHLELGWYQALHRALRVNGWRCLRGGDPRTTYIHPLNTAKRAPGLLEKVRRCVESGRVPAAQQQKWDLVEDDSVWVAPKSMPDLVVVLSPFNATQAQIERCIASLAGQTDRGFEVVVLEDALMPARTAELVSRLKIRGQCVSVMTGDEIMSFAGPPKSPASSLAATKTTMLVLGSDEALMAKSAIAQIKAAVADAGGVGSGCLCSAEGLRRSNRFGLGQMYPGEVAERSCLQPRCLTCTSEALPHAINLGYRPACAAFDVFLETPPPEGNLRPSVMGGFVVWREQKEEVVP